MSTKRRRPSTTGDRGNVRAKRIKFTLDVDDIHLPDINKNGTVLVTGAGDVGQLGLGPDVMEKTRPFAVPLDYEIVDICAGAMHTVCLTKDGKVITFGCNDEGALGRTTTDEDAEYAPGEVELPDKVKQITAGDSHSAALLENGRVFAWGTFRDSHGGMGLTPRGNERLPYELMPETTVIVKIASGADHIVFLTQHGTVYTCGCPEQGQLGRTTERGSSRNARISYGTDQLEKFLTPALITLKPSVRVLFDDIWAGTYTTFIRAAHSASGTSLRRPEMYVFGLNNYHQIGLVTPQPQFTPKRSSALSLIEPEQICSGQHHSIVRTKDGKIYALGRKEYGRLGLGENCEDATEPQEIIVAGMGAVVWVSCGATTSFAVTESGQLYGWGMGGGGQLGTGAEEDCFTPTLITGKQIVGRNVFRVSGGGQHTVIIASDTATTAKITIAPKSEQTSKTTEPPKQKTTEKKVNGQPVKGKSRSSKDSDDVVKMVDTEKTAAQPAKGRSRSSKDSDDKMVDAEKTTAKGKARASKDSDDLKMVDPETKAAQPAKGRARATKDSDDAKPEKISAKGRSRTSKDSDDVKMAEPGKVSAKPVKSKSTASKDSDDVHMVDSEIKDAQHAKGRQRASKDRDEVKPEKISAKGRSRSSKDSDDVKMAEPAKVTAKSVKDRSRASKDSDDIKMVDGDKNSEQQAAKGKSRSSKDSDDIKMVDTKNKNNNMEKEMQEVNEISDDDVV